MSRSTAAKERRMAISKYRAALKAGTKTLDVDVATDAFIQWSTRPERTILYNAEKGDYLGVMVEKRGNTKYAAKIKDRLNIVSDALQNFPLSFPDKDNSCCGSSRGLFLTLEFNPRFIKDFESWEISSAALNRFKASLTSYFHRAFFPDFEYFSCQVKEAHESGRCHIHLFMVLSAPLDCKKKQSWKKGQPTNNYFWRLSDYSIVLELKRLWDIAVFRSLCSFRGDSFKKCDKVPFTNFLDCQSVMDSEITGDDKKRSNVVGYLLKYLSKPVQKFKKGAVTDDDIFINRKSALTHALSKIFGARMIFGKKFLRSICCWDYDTIRHDILNNELKQLDNHAENLTHKFGDLRVPQSELNRIAEYKRWISSGFIPYSAVFERQQKQDPFSVYEKWRPPDLSPGAIDDINWHLEHCKKWFPIFHVRLSHHFDGKIIDQALKGWGQWWSSRHLRIDPAYGTMSPIAGLKFIVEVEGLRDLSPDFDLLFDFQ